MDPLQKLIKEGGLKFLIGSDDHLQWGTFALGMGTGVLGDRLTSWVWNRYQIGDKIKKLVNRIRGK